MEEYHENYVKKLMNHDTTPSEQILSTQPSHDKTIDLSFHNKIGEESGVHYHFFYTKKESSSIEESKQDPFEADISAIHLLNDPQALAIEPPKEIQQPETIQAGSGESSERDKAQLMIKDQPVAENSKNIA